MVHTWVLNGPHRCFTCDMAIKWSLKTKRIGTWILNLGVGAALFALLAPISANARGVLIATAVLLLLDVS